MRHIARTKLASALLIAVLFLGMGAFSVLSAAVLPQGESMAAAGLPVLIVQADDIEGGSDFKVLAPRTTLSVTGPTTTIQVTYKGNWDPAAKTAFVYAVSVWEGLISTDVPIKVVAEWVPMGPNVLGGAWAESAWRNFSGAPKPDTWYANALANKLSGYDLDPGKHDINAQFNSSFPGWYFGTDGAPGSSKYDFVSVVLHELAHGLGFFDSFEYSGGQGRWGYSGSPVAYDLFVVNGSGRRLIDTGIFGNPSSALGAQLVSNNLYFDGSAAVQANGGMPPQLYAPSTWAQGSSIAHLGEVFNNTPNALMTYSLSNGEVNHDPGPVVLGVFRDMGWAGSAPPTPTATPQPTSTPAPVLDPYEPDDTCPQASLIAADGYSHQHTFHSYGDQDWAAFETTTGATYVVQAISASPQADIGLALYSYCGGSLVAAEENDYSRDGILVFTAEANQPYMIQVKNQSPDAYGNDVSYVLSVREQSSNAVALIVAGNDDHDQFLSHALFSANQAYRTFINGGVPKANIRYLSPVNDPKLTDADGDGVSDVSGPASPADIESAITTWASGLVDDQTSFYLYLVGPGEPDAFLASGSAGKVSAQELDTWLSSLETGEGGRINVIYEANYSGSFLSGPHNIAGEYRTVVTSTGDNHNSYLAPGRGAYFSDFFFTALGQNLDLYASYTRALDAVQATGLHQIPLLDANGNGFIDEMDIHQAGSRGLANFDHASDRPPVIEGAAPPVVITNGQGVLSTRARDDIGLSRVWAVIYPPTFHEPAVSPALPQLSLTEVPLIGGNVDEVYSGWYDDFLPGEFRVVIYAEDNQGQLAQPVLLQVNASWTLFLPVLRR